MEVVGLQAEMEGDAPATRAYSLSGGLLTAIVTEHGVHAVVEILSYVVRRGEGEGLTAQAISVGVEGYSLLGPRCQWPITGVGRAGARGVCLICGPGVSACGPSGGGVHWAENV